MSRLSLLLVSSAFGLVLAIALMAGHPSAAFAGPAAPDISIVSPIGEAHTTGVDEWMPSVTPSAAPSPAVVVVSDLTSAPTPAAPTPAAAIDATVAAPQTTDRASTAAPAEVTPPAKVAAPADPSPAAEAAAAAADPATPTSSEPASSPPDVNVAVNYAIDQVGTPYQYAASGPNGFDCSGLTLAAYRVIGVVLPHHSEAQVDLGTGVDWQADGIRPGDLIVTAGGAGRHYAGHVGLAVSATEWVVAPSSGLRVTREAIPFDRIEAVRRLVAP